MHRITKVCSLCLLIPVLNAFAQELSVKIGDKSIPARKVDDAWAFTLDGTDYVILRNTDYVATLVLLEEARADLDSMITVSAADKGLIAGYASYKSSADTHLEKLTAANALCDSLYREYESLYYSCKKLVGINTFGFAFGGTLVKWGGQGPRPGAGPGLFLNNVLFSSNVELLALFGDGFWSVVGTVRLSPF